MYLSISCYAVFGGYPRKSCSFLKESGGGVDLGKGEVRTGPGEAERGKMRMGYIKNNK